VGEILERRQAETSCRLNEMRGLLASAESRCAGKACVYATGSFGRGEASPHSDLDLFIVGNDLTRLDEICVKADLIQVTRDLGIEEFSGDGAYLLRYKTSELIETLGKPEDDSSNTFTARLLLLLESRPLVEAQVYQTVTRDVIAAYWRDTKTIATISCPPTWRTIFSACGEPSA
jgi:predicted nucleotidyltransferase